MTSSSHSIVVNLTGANAYYAPSARLRVPFGWNVTDATSPKGLVVTGVGTGEVRIVVTENRTVASDTVLTVQPVSGPSPGRGRVSGRVLGAGGAPLAMAHVAAIRDGVEVVNVTTGPDGVFTCSDLPTGIYEIRISAEGYATRTLTIRVAESEILELGDIPLTVLSSTTGIIIGRIADDSRAPITDVSIMLIQGGTATAQTRSTGDGSFRFDGVSPGAYTIRIAATGFETQDISVQIVAGETVDLGEIVFSRSSTEGTGLGSWFIPAVAIVAIAGIAGGVLWVRRSRSRLKPPDKL